MRGYNKQIADDLAKDYEQLTGIELNSNSRKTEIMITRTLFYKILKDLNFMTDEMISDWFSTRGVQKGRSSITHAVKKIGIYYKSFASFRNTYNVYFNDKAEEFLTIEQAQKKRLNDSKQNIYTNTLNKDKDALEVLIDTIPEDKREEVREIVSLRVKSWGWKTKDECQVFLGETSMEGYCF
jgi:hypothetical protein